LDRSNVAEYVQLYEPFPVSRASGVTRFAAQQRAITDEHVRPDALVV
jgi:hypothetical protein